VIGRLYRSRGLWAKAYLPEQTIRDGIVKIQVVEAKLGKVVIEKGDKRLRFPESRIREFLAYGQTSTATLDVATLQESLKTLDNVPGIAATASLAKGEKAGRTNLLVAVHNTPVLSGDVGVDNYGSRSTGELRGRADLSLNSPFRHGEQFNVHAIYSKGLSYGTLGASYPILANGARFGISGSELDYTLGRPFQALDGSGYSTSLGAHLTYPLYRAFGTGVWALLSGTQEHFFNRTIAGVASDKKISAGSASVQFNRTDHVLAGGTVLASVTYTAGTLDLSGNGQDLANDQATARRNGGFEKVNFSLARLQRFTRRTSLWLSARGQMAFKNLDSSEKFYLGGPTGVRAYPTSEGAGDSGVLVTAELRHALNSRLQASVFYDYGYVRPNHKTWTGWNSGSPGLSNGYSLDGIGAGFTWLPGSGFQITGSLATRLGSNPAASATGKDGDGTRDIVRGWLNLTKYF